MTKLLSLSSYSEGVRICLGCGTQLYHLKKSTGSLLHYAARPIRLATPRQQEHFCCGKQPRTNCEGRRNPSCYWREQGTNNVTSIALAWRDNKVFRIWFCCQSLIIPFVAKQMMGFLFTFFKPQHRVSCRVFRAHHRIIITRNVKSHSTDSAQYFFI